MATDRVDKGWVKKGLEGYSNGAILGTLAHYGVAIDEAGFKALAQQRYPLAIARGWHATWKGTGQFSTYPAAAASELWRRLVTDRPSPLSLTEVLMPLIVELSRLIQGAPDAKVAASFQAVESLLPTLPKKEGGGVDTDFVGEALTYLDEQASQVFDELAERLAEAGHVEDAETFAALEERLLPDRAGVSVAVVKARSGGRDEAVASLVARAKDESKPGENRLLAVDALIHLNALAEAKAAAEPLLDWAEAAQDHHLALGTVSRLFHVMEQTKDAAAMKALMPRAEKLEQAHAHAHPHENHS